MSYTPSGDPSHDWEPVEGASGQKAAGAEHVADPAAKLAVDVAGAAGIAGVASADEAVSAPGDASKSAAGSALQTLYYLSDAQGSVIGLEGQDGSISARYRYDEYGVAKQPEKFDLNWPGPDNLFGYTSLGYDYYSGYSHAQARDFDSSIGRF